MKCPNIPSKINLEIDENNLVQFFKFERNNTHYQEKINLLDYLKGKKLSHIMELKDSTIIKELKIKDEKELFFLHVELDVLKCAISQYTNLGSREIDKDRCQIESIDHNPSLTKIIGIILPPKTFPQ